MEKRRTYERQRKALKPSQSRLVASSVDLPPRLVHMAGLPWVTCYRQALRAENKSENTQKSYASGLRALVETTLPQENVLDEAGYNAMTVEALAERMEPLNGRLESLDAFSFGTSTNHIQRSSSRSTASPEMAWSPLARSPRTCPNRTALTAHIDST